MNNAKFSFLRGYSESFLSYCQWGIDLIKRVYGENNEKKA
jgi:predicted glycosyltransferase involved in capsule biosynthesis